MIENRQLVFGRSQALGGRHPGERIEKLLGGRALRWYVSQIHDEEVVVEATITDGRLHVFDDVRGNFYPGKSVVVSIIPTGVGCELGGYAGDAAPATRLLAQVADYLVTNPNAVNASDFVDLEKNVLYTEGFCIDQFCKGMVDLYVPFANRVGLIVEKTTAEDLDIVFNVVNTARAVYGVDLVDVVVTDAPIGSHCRLNESGAYVGTVDHPEEIYKACAKLLDAGAQAIGVTTNIQDLPHDEYVRHFEGQFPNPLGGVEAIISHLIVNEFRVPAAHAPMINRKDLALVDPVVDARGAGEMSSPSGLACILLGLAKAPRIRREGRIRDAVNVNNLQAVVAPASCLGGIPALYAAEQGVPIVAVAENGTVLDVHAEKVGLDGVVQVRNYAEAAGVLLALRHGIALPSITRPLKTVRPLAERERLEAEKPIPAAA